MIKRILPCVMAFMFVFCLPSVALAVGGEPKVNWSEDGNICRIWISRNNTPDYPCENQYDAASWMLGVNPASLTDEQKAKLSNESSGGQFWVFAQAIEGSTGDDLDLGLYPGLPAFQTIYGQYFYAVECDKSLFYAAQNDLHVILSGGSLGGGGGTGLTNSLEFPIDTYYGTNKYYTGSTPWAASFTFNFGDNTELYRRIETYNAQYDYAYALLWANNTGTSNVWFSIDFIYTKTPATINPNATSSQYVFSYSGENSGDCVYWQIEPSRVSTVTNGANVINGYGYINSVTTGKNISYFNHSRLYLLDSSNSTGGGGSGSDTFWPSPTGGEPEPPTPPDPVDPEPPEPDPPTPPDLPDPYMPIVEPEPTGTDPIDYTPWLRAILRELQNFHRDNIAVLNSINSQIVSSSNAIIADLNYMLDYGLGQIHDEFSATRSYLRECLEWLAEQMDFSFTADGYDDTSVVSYLRQILYELQKAPDVTTNPFDFFGWLNGLLGNLLSGLLGAVLGSLASFTEPLEALTGKFPFSLPWDLAAILALFVAPAQVPIFDIPFAGYGSVHVDLSGFDVVAQVVRALMLVLFAYGLTQRTKDMLDLIDKIVG